MFAHCPDRSENKQVLRYGYTTFHTINFNRKINTAADNSEMKWLIHEFEEFQIKIYWLGKKLSDKL